MLQICCTQESVRLTPDMLLMQNRQKEYRKQVRLGVKLNFLRSNWAFFLMAVLR